MQAAAGDLALVIDDIGYSKHRGLQTLALPGNFTIAVLPFAPHTQSLVRSANNRGIDIIIHQPMEPQAGPHVRLEADTLRVSMSAAEMNAAFARSLAAVPQRLGVSNHTGSLFTQHRGHMALLMHQLKAADLFFLDSRTTAATVAVEVAEENGVLAMKRDVFLDHTRTAPALERSWAKALRIARRQGSAILVGHPYPISLKFLEEQLSTLPADINLVGLAELAAKRRARQTATDPAALAQQPDPADLHISLGR